MVQITPDYTGARSMMLCMPTFHFFASDARHHQRQHGPGDVATKAWAAWYNTWLLIKLTPKGAVFPFLSFPFLFVLK